MRLRRLSRALWRSVGHPAPHAVALTLLATSLLSPAQSCGDEEVEDPERNVEAKLGLPSVLEMRTQSARLDGVTVLVRVESSGSSLRVNATIRNDSSKRYVLEWPTSCRRGREIFLSGATALVTRSRGSVSDRRTDGFNWEDRDPSEREPDFTYVALEPATQLTEEVRMVDPARECTNEEDGRTFWGRDPSQIAPFTNVLVGYELFEFLEPEFISHVTPDGRGDRRRAPARTLIIGEAPVQPLVRLARKRDRANEVQRIWSVSRPTPYQ